MSVIVSSGEEPVVVSGQDWMDVLVIPDDVDVNFLVLINEGGSPGFWRLLYADGETSPSTRMPPGPVSANIPVPDGFAGGKLQVKRTIAEGDVTGVYAWAAQTEAEYEYDDEDDDEADDANAPA